MPRITSHQTMPARDWMFSHAGVPFLLMIAAAAIAAPPGTAQPPITNLSELVVTAERQPAGSLLSAEALDLSSAATLTATDTAGLLRHLPGVAIVRNGPQTGIVQLHGLSGDRVRIAVDGMAITPACPNHMDPPLHYLAPGSVDSLRVMAGISPVSAGGDSIAGSVSVESPASRFADGADWFTSARLATAYRGSNDSFGMEAGSSIANATASASYQGAWTSADDLRFPGGRVSDTGYHTQSHRIMLGHKVGQGVLAIDAGLLRTGDSGTPALPMDMIEDDGCNLGARFNSSCDFGTWSARVYYHHIDHLMDNFSMRPLVAGAMPMFSPATSDDIGGNLNLSVERHDHTLRIGSDFHTNRFDARQQNASTGMLQDTLHEVTRSRLGAYLEVESRWTNRWSTQAGLRSDIVLSRAAALDH